ncbi:MAG TPA: sigma-54 dependent transcriptional regulator [Rugosibacter sp.]|nr:sigma-54 dependent transcriptional regulator [Rugosibacter sp.]HPB91516.1 sigma-54 dependent transcriptional regulator [Rugosibacter sp.]HPB91568.1 sigma-54 dependent transcriptional regulator [Rugosibacter sp.]
MSVKTPRRRQGEILRVLVVDDEADIRELLDLTLARMGLAVDCAASLSEAYDFLGKNSYQLCLTDMRLGDGTGLDLVRYVNANLSNLPVAVVTAYGSTENAVAALKEGAFDYLAKPVSLDQLRSLVQLALELPSGVAKSNVGQDKRLLGNSPAIQAVRELIERVARSQAPVHITGESGSGKELAAQQIHKLSARRDRPFVPVNCGAIPENLMESEFFGYRKGAFTGANDDRDGFFQAANGGTLFLDEVADLPLIMQVKLLRVIQEKRVRKLGAPTEDDVDVRIICATHQDMKALVDVGKFRQDLFYRLNVIELRMPLLRECVEDIPVLAEHILERLAHSAGIRAPLLTKEALSALSSHPFSGNVRELENTLERALALMSGNYIEVADLNLRPSRASGTPSIEIGHAVKTLQDTLDQVERKMIQEALFATQNNRTAAAKMLGVTFRSLRYRMARLDMNE